jgi:transcriptional regulator with XRE-family HTH domain
MPLAVNVKPPANLFFASANTQRKPVHFAKPSLAAMDGADENAPVVPAIDYVRAFLVGRISAWGGQTQAANRTGVSQGYLNAMLKGEEKGRNPTLSTIDRLAKGFGMEVPELFAEGARLLNRPVAAPGDKETVQEGGAAELESGYSSPAEAGPPVGTPGKDSDVVLPALPASSVHLTLYGLIGDLTEEQARVLRRPLLDLVEQIQHPSEPDKPNRKK